MNDLIKRLREACNVHPAAKIPWPHRILHEAADAIESLQYEVDAIPAIKAERDYQAEETCRKDALLRQALEALEITGLMWPAVKEAITAIKQELEMK